MNKTLSRTFLSLLFHSNMESPVTHQETRNEEFLDRKYKLHFCVKTRKKHDIVKDQHVIYEEWFSKYPQLQPFLLVLQKRISFSLMKILLVELPGKSEREIYRKKRKTY